jgi:transglycosylase-like protein with SLT domain
MECQRIFCARTQRLLTNWEVAAMLCLMQLFAVGAPLRGQTSSGKASDPFAVVHQKLEVAADQQLAVRPGQLVATKDPHATEEALPRGGEFAPPRTGSTAEQRFRSLGVKAGAIFREFGVPLALLNVAQVESNWNPLALSPKGAFGLWQLMPATARRYGLRVDVASDDRADTDKATRAAAHYLRDLHEQFGDWALALAAYNAGEDGVEKAMERGKSHDFWSLSERKLLPAETRAYVPVVLASFDPSGTKPGIGLGESNGKFIPVRIVYAAGTRQDRIEEPAAIGSR